MSKVKGSVLCSPDEAGDELENVDFELLAISVTFPASFINIFT